MNDVLKVYQDSMAKSGFNFMKFWKEMDQTLKTKYNTDNAKFFGLFFNELEKGNPKLIKDLDIVKILDTFPERWKKERVSDDVLMKSVPPKHWEDFRDSSWLKQHVKSCVTNFESNSKVAAAMLAAGLFTEKGVNVTALKKILVTEPNKVKADAETKPSIYVGTYKKYNEGNLKGKWLNLEDYADKEAFFEACAELHKDEEDPELMFQDFEGFPKRFYHESSVPDALWGWIELDEDDREILEIYIDEVVNDDNATIDTARDALLGKAGSKEDWAQEFLDDTGGLSTDQLGYYLTMSDTDRQLFAQEEADNRAENRDDDDVLKEADLRDEYEAEEADTKKEAILEKAKEAVRESEYEETYKAMEDPVDYFVEQQGIYTLEELAKASFISIDYEAYARDAELSGDVTFVRKDGEVWVFSNH